MAAYYIMWDMIGNSDELQDMVQEMKGILGDHSYYASLQTTISLGMML